MSINENYIIETLARNKECMDARELKKALVLLEECDETICDDRVKNNLAWFYFKIGMKSETSKKWYYQPQLAKNIFEIAITLSKSHYPFSNLGEVYLALEQETLACEVLEKAVKIEATLINQNNWAVSLIKLGEFNVASSVLRKICNINQEKQENYVQFYNYAITLFHLNEKGKLKDIVTYLYQEYCKQKIENTLLDAVDISLLLHLAENYVHANEIFPQNGYEIYSNNFLEHLLTLKYLNKMEEMFMFKQEVIEDLYEEINDQDVQLNNLIIQSKKNKIAQFEDIYNRIIREEKVELTVPTIVIPANYLF